MPPKLEFTVTGDARDGLAALDQTNRALGGVASSFKRMGELASGFVLGSAVLQAPAVIGSLNNKARDLELQMKKVQIVFGTDQAGDVKDWADEVAHAMGLTSRQAQGLAANFADLLIPMGFSREQAAKMSTDVVGLSGALAEWSGGTRSASEVAQILSSAMLGERDALKGLGISISEADVQQRLAANGAAKLTGAALEQASAIATQQLIMEKSTDAQKAFAEGAGSAARKQAEMGAKIAELKENLATGLAPAFLAVSDLIATKVVPVIVQMAEWLGPRIREAINTVKPQLQEFAAKVGEFVETARPHLAAFADAARAQFAKFAGYYHENIEPAAQNIIAAVRRIVGEIEERWPMIEGVIRPILEQVQNTVQTFVGIVTGLFNVVIQLLKGDFGAAWDALKGVVQVAMDGVRETIENALQLLKGLVKLFIALGGDLVQGIIDGVQKAAGAAVEAVGKLASDLIKSAKEKLKVWSPSQVFAEIGENISLGLAAGITHGAAEAQNALALLLHNLGVQSTVGAASMVSGGEMVTNLAGEVVTKTGNFRSDAPLAPGSVRTNTGAVIQHINYGTINQVANVGGPQAPVPSTADGLP